MTAKSSAGAGSQTLARGLRALTLIGEAPEPLSVAQLAAALGVHRSIAYRLVRTLGESGFIGKTRDGKLELGARIAQLARNVAPDLQSAAHGELTELANDLEMTAFLVVYDGQDAVTLLSIEPRLAETTLAQRPGSRHAIDRGAPGRVLRSQIDPERFPPAPFETSHDEIIAGISAVAVPLRTADGRPASVAVLYVSNERAVDAVAERLRRAAESIERALGVSARSMEQQSA